MFDRLAVLLQQKNFKCKLGLEIMKYMYNW